MGSSLKDFKEDLTEDLIKKYDVRGSFYTDYPPLGLLSEKYSYTDYEKAMTDLMAKGEDNPALLYFHIPFCEKLCYYCQCNSIVANDYQKALKFLSYLSREIDILRNFFQKHSLVPNIKEIHLGGGTPSYFKREEFEVLLEKIQSLVDIRNLEEFTIEVDPRTVDEEQLKYYGQNGMNRLSFGIQEFDPDVQKAINRIQPPELIESLLTPEVRKYFTSVNFDLIFGMPLQTRDTFRKTIDRVVKLSPDRIALCVLGYRPDIFKHHNVIKKEDLPSPYERTMIGQEAIQQLIDNGYVRIGLDHFAKPTDELAKAMKNRKMHRSALGYTPGRYQDMIGIGPSSMSRITSSYYFQNYYELPDYENAIDNGRFPIFRGYKMRPDDIIRRDIIHRIMNYYSVDIKCIEKTYGIVFKEYFEEDIELLKDIFNDGIAFLREDFLEVSPLGKCFLRNICTCFDKIIREGLSYKHSRQYKETAKGESFVS